MSETLDSVQGKIASVIDQDEVTSNIASTDYSLRRAYINMAQREWAEIYDWKSLYRESNVRTTQSTGNASITMPDDYRKLAGFPKITYDGTDTYTFPEIRPQERFMYVDTDKYVYILGDANVGHTMVVQAGTICSGASVFIPYYASPASLVSPADRVMCPNPEYLVQRSLAYIWESQSDARFQQAKIEADKILKNLLEREQVYGEGYLDKIETTEKKDFGGFRWGRD